MNKDEIEFFIGATTAGGMIVAEKEGMGYFWKVSLNNTPDELYEFLMVARNNVEKEMKKKQEND